MYKNKLYHVIALTKSGKEKRLKTTLTKKRALQFLHGRDVKEDEENFKLKRGDKEIN